jgi:glycosyltransferase involved in cell wall biosynthesis
VKVFTHNFDPNSNTGPNKFTRTLLNRLIKDDKIKISVQQEADVEFCLIQQQVHKVKPMILRLDGIWFNSDQDHNRQNAPIKFAYQNADAVIFQSEFNKKLTEHWFGRHDKASVIHNAADLDLMKAANPNFWDKKFGKDTEVWSCAANWRPHKRLNENIRYFLEFAPKDAIFAIAGALGMDDAKKIPNDKRIVLMGDLDYMSLLSLYKRSTTFIHLAYLDHCPNVVVDAQAAGCKIVCSSTGGTNEIVRSGIIIHEMPWNFKPIKLYNPPHIKWDERFQHRDYEEENKPSIVNCAKRYYNVMKEIM